jgi:hypothetical protein
MMMRLALLAGLGTALVLPAAPAAAQKTETAQVERRIDRFALSFSTGLDYSSGRYGAAERTEILVVPLSMRTKTGPVAVSATLPWIRIDGPGGVVIGPGGEPLPGVPTTGGRRDGLGDLSLGASYTIPGDVLGGLELGFGGRVKLPTSPRRKGLSTGKADVSVSTDLTWNAAGVAPFVNLGYRFLGDPAGTDLRNGPTASAGATVQLGRSSVLIASYDYARASSRTSHDAHELFAGVSAPVSSRFNVTGYGVAGLSKGSPDVGVGLLLTAKLF